MTVKQMRIRTNYATSVCICLAYLIYDDTEMQWGKVFEKRFLYILNNPYSAKAAHRLPETRQWVMEMLTWEFASVKGKKIEE